MHQNYETEDSNETVLYDTKYSSKTDAITISVYTTESFNIIKQLLTDRYVFQPNKNSNGIETSITDGDFRTVVTLYNNKTLFVQGKGCWAWKIDVFKVISEELKENVNLSISDGEDCNQTPINASPPQEENGPKSPLFYLSRMVNSLRSPSKRTPIKGQNKLNSQLTTPVSSKIKPNLNIENKGESTLETPNVNKSMPKTKSNPKLESNSSSRINNQSQSNVNEETNVKQVVENDSILDRKELEKSVKLLRSKLNEQHEKSGKFEHEIARLKNNLKSQTERNEKISIETNEMKNDLSNCKAKVLVCQEENGKLKNKIERLSKEKADLVTQLIKVQISSESIDTQIQNATDSMEMKMATEMKSLKQSLLQELSDIKSQIKTVPSESMNKSKIPNDLDRNTKNISKGVNSTKENTESQTEKNKSLTKAVNMKSAFIAGDSITKRLSPSKMSDKNLKVKIKSHPGGKIETIEKTFCEMNDIDKDTVENADAVVLHIGTNNVSNDEDHDDIVSKMESTITKIQTINPETAIVISSILPRKSEKVVNNIIDRTNRAIETMCNKKGYHFLNNDKVMMKNGRPDFSLYQDNIHLNKAGGKVLGTYMRHSLEKILDVPANTTHESGVLSNYNSNRNRHNKWSGDNNGNKTRHNNWSGDPSFQNGRFTGGRMEYANMNRNMMYMPVPAWALKNWM